MVRCSQYDALVELATICALCNDSSLDYNEVCTCIHTTHMRAETQTPLFKHLVCLKKINTLIFLYINIVAVQCY